MMKVGVITNPRSQRNKAGLDEMHKSLTSVPAVRHVILDSVAEIPDILLDFARQEIEVVAVAGGDGTVQAVLTGLLGQRAYEQQPRLAVVPRGMTNMIASDVGLRRRGLARLLRAASEGNLDSATVTRHILRIDNARGMIPQYGMFLGGAGIYRAVVACRDNVHPYNIRGETAAAVTLAGVLGGWLLRSGRGVDGTRDRPIFSGDRVDMVFDNQPPQTHTSLVILATTLERLILGSRPFWNGGEGPLYFTNIAYPPSRFLRYAWRILYGKENRDLPAESYLSRRANRVALTMDCPFTLDGEFFEPEPDTPIIVTAADQVRFLRI